jgi:hypothetical protein
VKICSKCNLTKPLADYYKDKTKIDGHRAMCKACNRESKKTHTLSEEAKAKRKAYCREYSREYNRAKCQDPRFRLNKHLKHKYGITIEEYEDMLDKQGGVCYICHRECKVNGRLCVDHCHRSGKVRALLCTQCNGALGLAEDSVITLKKMIAYLEMHS